MKHGCRLELELINVFLQKIKIIDPQDSDVEFCSGGTVALMIITPSYSRRHIICQSPARDNENDSHGNQKKPAALRSKVQTEAACE